MTGRKRYNMKHLVASTAKVEKRIDMVKVERMTGVSITDKAMTTVAVDTIDTVSNMYVFDVETEEGTITQAIIATDDIAYSTCSAIAVDLIRELIQLVNKGEVSLSEIGFNVNITVSKAGNKYLDLQLM